MVARHYARAPARLYFLPGQHLLLVKADWYRPRDARRGRTRRQVRAPSRARCPPLGETHEGHHLAVAEFGRGRYRRSARGLLRKASAAQLPSGRGTYGPLPPILGRQRAVQNGKQRVDKILARILAAGAVVLVASSCYHKTADTPPEPAIGDNHPAARPVAAPTTDAPLTKPPLQPGPHSWIDRFSTKA